jgi:putative transposase
MNIGERSITAERLVTELETAFTLAGRPAEGIADGQRTEVDFSRAATVLREQTGLVYIPPGRPWVNGHIESFNNRIPLQRDIACLYATRREFPAFCARSRQDF